MFSAGQTLKTVATDGWQLTRFRTCFGPPWLGKLVLLMLVCCPAISACAQESWVFAPYEVHVWIGLGPSPRLTVRHRNDIQRRLTERALAWVGYGWNVESEAVPAELNTDVTRNLALLSSESVVEQILGRKKEKSTGKTPLASKPDSKQTKTTKPDSKQTKATKPESSASTNRYRHLLRKDKLFLLGVTDLGSSWRVQVRELDLHTRTIGPLVERLVQHPSKLADASFDAVAEAFHPIARVDSSEGKSAELTLRAGGLIQSKKSPLYVGPRAVFRPVVRRNNRVGEPLKEGVVEIDWTYIYVDQENQGRLKCQVWSAMRNPVAGRSSSRTQRFGLLVRPTGRPTELKLVAQNDESHALKGYDVFAKTPQPLGKDAKLSEEEEAQKLGRTDWRGVIEIEPIKSGVRVIYVKNGQQLLARLPMVPGYYPQQTAVLPNDDSRLKVESFVTGIQNSLLDLVIQQKVLEIRIRGKLKQNKNVEAKTLLGELRALTTVGDLETLLQSKEQEVFSESKIDLRLERKIRQLFRQTRELMAKYFDPDLEAQLVQEVANPGKGRKQK